MDIGDSAHVSKDVEQDSVMVPMLPWKQQRGLCASLSTGLFWVQLRPEGLVNLEGRERMVWAMLGTLLPPLRPWVLLKQVLVSHHLLLK